MDEYRILPIESKTGISKAALPETFMTSLYRSQATYRGCAHGCRYCDGRAEKYYVEGDFERDIAARTNLPDLVARDVADGAFAREWGAVGIGSGVTDVYQPCEREVGLTRRTIEAMISRDTGRADVPLVILTKSDLILRDFDLFAKFPKALVIVTVTTTDPDVARIIEPGASLPAERLEVVRRAKEAGFFSGVMAMPLCPGISDTDESTMKLFDAAAEAGADFVYPGGLTIRPGRQKDLFVSTIAQRWREFIPLYDFVYQENRQSGMPLLSYAAPLAKKWDRELAARNIPQMIPHRVYRELLSPADSLFVLFCHMGHLYDMRGVNTKPLKSAVDRYAEWLRSERATLRRKRAMESGVPFPVTEALTKKLEELCGKKNPPETAQPADDPLDLFGDFEQNFNARDSGTSGTIPPDAHAATLESILGNKKLSELAERIVLDGAYFDYSSLTLKL
jgi:DNA repair photolyase